MSEHIVVSGPDPDYVPAEHIVVAFLADTPEEAVMLAKAWCRAEPRLTLRTLGRVDRDPANPGLWHVTLVVRRTTP